MFEVIVLVFLRICLTLVAHCEFRWTDDEFRLRILRLSFFADNLRQIIL